MDWSALSSSPLGKDKIMLIVLVFHSNVTFFPLFFSNAYRRLFECWLPSSELEMHGAREFSHYVSLCTVYKTVIRLHCWCSRISGPWYKTDCVIDQTALVLLACVADLCTLTAVRSHHLIRTPNQRLINQSLDTIQWIVALKKITTEREKQKERIHCI